MKTLGTLIAASALIPTLALAEVPNSAYVRLEPGVRLEDKCGELAANHALKNDLTKAQCVNAVYYFYYTDTSARSEYLSRQLFSQIYVPFPFPDTNYPEAPDGLGASYESAAPPLATSIESERLARSRRTLPEQKLARTTVKACPTCVPCTPQSQTTCTPSPNSSDPFGGMGTRILSALPSLPEQITISTTALLYVLLATLTLALLFRRRRNRPQLVPVRA